MPEKTWLIHCSAIVLLVLIRWCNSSQGKLYSALTQCFLWYFISSWDYYSFLFLPTEGSEVMFGDRAALVWLSDPVFCSQALQQDKCRLMNQGCPVEGHPLTGTANFSAAVSLDTGNWTQTPFEAWSQCISPLAGIVYGDRTVKVSAATANSHLTLNLKKTKQ